MNAEDVNRVVEVGEGKTRQFLDFLSNADIILNIRIISLPFKAEAIMKQVCKDCLEEKDISEFSISRGKWYHRICKKCRSKKISEYQRIHYDPTSRRNENLLSNYGISLSQYEARKEKGMQDFLYEFGKHLEKCQYCRLGYLCMDGYELGLVALGMTRDAQQAVGAIPPDSTDKPVPTRTDESSDKEDLPRGG